MFAGWRKLPVPDSPKAAAVHHMNGLRAIAELPGLRRRILVHRGERPTLTDDGIDSWPVSTFLEALATDGLWP